MSDRWIDPKAEEVDRACVDDMLSDRWIDPEVEESIRACVDQLLGQKAEGTVVPFPMDRITRPDRAGRRLRRAGPLGPRLVQ